MLSKVKALIELFHFTPLPIEKTLFSSTYRSEQELPGGGPVGTAMLGLYCHDPLSHSLFHKLPVDEIWHFYSGDPLQLMLLFPDGSSRKVILGSDPLRGNQVQFVIPAGTWQAGCMVEGGRYSLFGCTMAPGFTDTLFEGGVRESLLAKYPDQKAEIERFSCSADQTRMPEGFAS
ncbi:MAG: cupin domain-containing protein [Chloroflexi bacterium]|nr:cupin domain-containing protein [Chloroflexota bacterium]